MLGKKWNRQVPVYLFTGFLESGKTSFLNDSMIEEDFAGGERNLCILTEKGEIKPDLEGFKKFDVKVEYVTKQENFTPEYLGTLNDKYRPEKILIEVNGMWPLEPVYNNLPENWVIVQEMSFFNSQTFNMFNTNMRNQVFEKFKYADMVIFNRVKESDDPMVLHKAVRVANRGTKIVYEMEDGTIKIDEVEDPLPFDVNADFIDLSLRDYAYWYRDIMAEAIKYKGKKMKFSGIIKTKGINEKDRFVVGRPIMQCCAEDIQFMGMRCTNHSDIEPEHNGWATITATVMIGMSREYGEVPVLSVESIVPGEMPDDDTVLATFY